MRQLPATGRRIYRHRTTFRLAAALAGTAMLATACGGGSADDGPVTIRFSWWGNEERARITNQAVDAFEEANPGIRVETESIDFESYFDRLSTSVAAGDEPDVITMGGAYPREYAERDVLLDLSEVSEQLDLGALDEQALSNGEFDGSSYGVPTGVNTFAVIANPAVFEEAGVELPDDDAWSWADYADIAEEISSATSGDTYGSEDPTQPDTLDLYANQRTGLGLYSPEGGVAVEQGTVTQWFELTTGMADAGATPSASMTAELAAQAAPEQTLLGQGRAGMKLAWSNQLAAFREGSGDDLVLLRAPGETTAQGTGMWLQASQLYTISRRSEHPEAAAKLVDFLVNDPAAAEFIKSDRGIPANPEIRAHLEGDLTDSQKVEFAFVDRMSGLVDGDFVIGPTGSTESVDLLQRTNESVLFGRQSPAEGAEQFVTGLTDAVS
ncbi:ABC transporter substrate-binding protein [Streptomonospora litoralis]|uniref:ABC transporter substrate-binding protein YesO n=1 Tax=Streptomonospora litoralis TaxID=2498135 RepID=A0A4P6Q0T6_9ACTN|nr:extracellular solute-binding protein [Streptomonospora litoralis]QBI52157.1 Putative ABC transporter substrate-binding protein YesO [Streptomonospora litoralis]